MFMESNCVEYAVFNSITDNIFNGNEREFTKVREKGLDDTHAKKCVSSGKEYEMNIFYRNEADFQTNKTGYGMSTNTCISSFFPEKILSGEEKGVAGHYDESKLMELPTQVSMDEENWGDSVIAKLGEFVTVKVMMKNIGSSTLTNVIIKSEFQKGLSLRYGSTKIFDVNHVEGKTIDDIIDLSGYNIGDALPGALIQVCYQVKVNNKATYCGMSLSKKISFRYNGRIQNFNSARVRVIGMQ